MMRDFEELIAALAEGTLDDAAAREAEAALARHPDGASALADHRRALAAIRDTGVVSMSLEERQSVREAVAGAIGLGVTETAAVARPFRRSLWPALAGSAAVLVAMLAIVPMLSDLQGDGDGDAAFELTIRTGESVADDAGTLDLTESDPVLSFGGDPEADNQPLFADGQQSARSTVVEAPPETEDTTEAPIVTTTQPAGQHAETTTTTLAKSTEMGDPALLDELDEEMQSPSNRFDSAPLADEETDCVDIAAEILPTGTDEQVFVFAYERDDKPTLLVFFGVDDEGVVDRLAVLDPDGCDPLAARG
ncbi:MAG TPA: hypothetical protein VMM81_06220 [Acidimicrobiia bacterium]|nr:hypothetical protein [Acidimicrobiia bacterium]